MSLLNYFINEESEEADKTSKPVAATHEKEAVKFPVGYKQITTFPTAKDFPITDDKQTVYQPITQSIANPFVEKLLEVYDTTFTKLNQPGYDFYEFFRAVSKSGIDNPMAYEMALDMGQTMESTITKQLLISQADFYVNELNKLHDNILSEGQAKSNDLTNKKNSESNNLTSELESLKQQLKVIQIQIDQQENALSQIDNKYQPDINNIVLKLSANDSARDTFVNKINKVKTNISNNLK